MTPFIKVLVAVVILFALVGAYIYGRDRTADKPTLRPCVVLSVRWHDDGSAYVVTDCGTFRACALCAVPARGDTVWRNP